MSIAQQIVDAFQQRLAVALNVDVPKNQSEPPRLTKGQWAVRILGGGFEPPTYDEDNDGTRVDRKHVAVELYVAVAPDQDPEPALHDLRDRVIRAFDGYRDLGGLLYGWSNDQDVEPHFDGMEEGECVALAFDADHASGGALSIDFLLAYGTNRKGQLVVREREDAEAA